MRRRNVGRLICTFVIVGVSALGAASCGSSPNASVYVATADGGPDVVMPAAYVPDSSLVSDAATGPQCTPKTCAALGFSCGKNGDGCGGVLDCGSCSGTQFCGGGGYSKCGGDTTKAADGGSLCTPNTCAAQGFNCGATGDGCGGVLQCGSGDGGSDCPAGQFCGGGGPNQCGGSIGPNADAGSPCVPKTCQSLGYACGAAGDGCGNLLQCGSCSSPQFCGGGGPYQCGLGPTVDGGMASPCMPWTCQTLGFTCGAAGDGCGGQLDCGTCASPAFCGGGGFDKCGTTTSDGGTITPCIPKTCTTLGYNCGPAADGCGGLLQCGSCTGGNICGGGGQPNVCGSSIPCTNLCQQQVACSGGGTTSISGRVVAGTLPTYGTPDPVPNVLVYVPNAPLKGFSARVQCSQCGADVSGSPLVTATTKFDGTFTLPNVPVGTQIPVVIQLGRWRRGVYIDITNQCANTNVGDIHMPRNEGDADIAGSANIPLTGLSTGQVDAMECVLLKMGVDAAEFTQPAGGGRIQMYQGNGASAGNNTPNEAALMDTGGSYMSYDQIILPCWGKNPVTDNTNVKSATELADLVTYANGGGHFFATHFSYTWLTIPSWTNATPGPFNGTAQWDINKDTNTNNVPFTGNVSLVVPPAHPGVFAQWLGLVGALSNANPPRVTIQAGRHDADHVLAGSSDWIDGTDPKNVTPKQMLLHYTFDTPVGAATQCGHAIYSDFHVTNQNDTSGFDFTQQMDRDSECGTNPMDAQEKILEFMIWDLASCVPPPATPTCTPLNCAQQKITCGPAGDGCGNQIDCGPCPPPLDGGLCAPQTCQQQGISCGPAGDGCGAALDCGSCPVGQTCGGNGLRGQCVPLNDGGGGSCMPQSCMQQNIQCGPAGDGCGNQINCGMCPPGQTCGGGGVPGVCGGLPEGGSCAPTTCSAQNISCGPAGDGCGNLLNCGSCPAGQNCGGCGIPGQCGNCGGMCVPLTCADLMIACGPAGDGCGGLLDCGQCPAGQTCGAAGPGQCGGGTH